MPSGLAPGIYLEERPHVPLPPFTTGVPAFLGATGLSEVLRLTQWGAPGCEALQAPLSFAVRGFFANGGSLCYVLPDTLGQGNDLKRSLDGLEEIDLLCAPTLCTAPLDTQVQTQVKLLELCEERGDLFAILDSVREPEQLEAYRERLTLELGASPSAASYGALYFPWLQVAGACATCGGSGQKDSTTCLTCMGTGSGPVPPSGHVAGLYSRTDRSDGVFRAPANKVVEDAVNITTRLPPLAQGKMNSAGVNVISAFPGRGIRLWGARTLSDEPMYRDINVRRLVITLGRWLQYAMKPLVFEQNTPLLWIRSARTVSTVLDALFERGAFAGTTPAESYYVKCDEDTNPPDVRAAGQVVTELGIAPARPSEFIIVNIIQDSQGMSMTSPG